MPAADQLHPHHALQYAEGGADLGDLQRDGIWLARLMLIAMTVAVRRVRHTLD